MPYIQFKLGEDTYDQLTFGFDRFKSIRHLSYKNSNYVLCNMYRYIKQHLL